MTDKSAAAISAMGTKMRRLRVRAGKARATARALPWIIRWAPLLWALLLGHRADCLAFRVSAIRRRWRDEQDKLMAGHRAGRMDAYRQATQREGNAHGRL